MITLASAMRYEPANVKYFSDEMEAVGVRSALLGLGCFNAAGAVAPSVMKPNEALLNRFHAIFTQGGGGSGSAEVHNGKFCLSPYQLPVSNLLFNIL